MVRAGANPEECIADFSKAAAGEGEICGAGGKAGRGVFAVGAGARTGEICGTWTGTGVREIRGTGAGAGARIRENRGAGVEARGSLRGTPAWV